VLFEGNELSSRDRVLISTCLALITALAWAYLIYLDRRMSVSVQYDTLMAAMGMTTGQSWTAADVFFAVVMWTVMMVGMMGGTAAPVLLLFGAARAGRGQRGVRTAVLLFGLGYVTVWIGFSVCAALVQGALHQAAMLSPAMSASSPHLAGAILIAAGMYQLTPYKGACLARCRSPLGFFMTSWRDGNIGALRMGAGHGGYCLGCCWAVMCVLFVVGVMNLLWVAALSVFVLFEKVGPAGAAVARVAGAVMIVAGVLVVAGVA
jgi:predicted metal-binding membrane protein